MKALHCLAACALAAGLLPGPATAQTVNAAGGPPPVSWRAALDAAWQRAVMAREAEGQRRRAAAEQSAARPWWAAPPSLSLSHRNDRLHGRAGSHETEIGVAVPLWLPGQRQARADAADATLAQAAAAERLARLQLAGELREAAWRLAAAQADAAQADALAQSLAQIAADVQRRVKAGDLAPADALAAQAEKLSALALQTEARQRLLAARAQWTLLTGLDAPPDLVAPPAAATPGDDAAALADHPELQLAGQTVALARQRIELQRRSRRDAPELGLGVRQDVSGRGAAAQGSLVLSLRLPWGGDDRNLLLEVAALSELELAQAQAQRLRERLDSDIATARSAVQAAVQQQAAESQRARLLRERATLIDQSFRAGESPLPELLRALAAAAQADSAAARQTAALGLAHARLHHVMGLLP